jgi:hypothetical protein
MSQENLHIQSYQNNSLTAYVISNTKPIVICVISNAKSLVLSIMEYLSYILGDTNFIYKDAAQFIGQLVIFHFVKVFYIVKISFT